MHNDAKCTRLEYVYVTDTEDPQVGSFLIFYLCTSIYFNFLDLCTSIYY